MVGTTTIQRNVKEMMALVFQWSPPEHQLVVFFMVYSEGDMAVQVRTPFSSDL